MRHNNIKQSKVELKSVPFHLEFSFEDRIPSCLDAKRFNSLGYFEMKSRRPPLPKSPRRKAPEMNDEEDLQRTLAAAQLKTKAEDNIKGKEVLYNDGATPLYTAIEETRWSEVMELLDVIPEQARIWVKSTGTENTTFGWSLWKRLPIHEACRRQAPAWIIAALLHAFPESVTAVTQFGELPLHCAVECGATPEVVNLLLVNNYEGILACDASGRTPVQIVTKDESMMDPNDYYHIQESLASAHNYLSQSNEKWEKKLESLKLQHEEEMKRKEANHREQSAAERKVIAHLQNKLSQAEDHFVKVQDEKNSLKKTISMHSTQREEWQNTLGKGKESLVEMKDRLQAEHAESERLKTDIEKRDACIVILQKRIAILEDDLRNVSVLQRDVIGKTLQQVEMDLRIMVESQQILQGQLKGQTRGLEVLASKRGIELPMPQQDDEEKKEEIVDDNVNFGELACQAAKAANEVIMKAEHEQALVDLENEAFE